MAGAAPAPAAAAASTSTAAGNANNEKKKSSGSANNPSATMKSNAKLECEFSTENLTATNSLTTYAFSVTPFALAI